MKYDIIMIIKKLRLKMSTYCVFIIAVDLFLIMNCALLKHYISISHDMKCDVLITI